MPLAKSTQQRLVGNDVHQARHALRALSQQPQSPGGEQAPTGVAGDRQTVLNVKVHFVAHHGRQAIVERDALLQLPDRRVVELVFQLRLPKQHQSQYW